MSTVLLPTPDLSRDAAPPKRRKAWAGQQHRPTPAEERVGQTSVPLVWVEKSVLHRLKNIISIIDAIPLKLAVHEKWVEVRTEAWRAHEDVTDLLRTALTIFGAPHNIAPDICHMKSGKGAKAKGPSKRPRSVPVKRKPRKTKTHARR